MSRQQRRAASQGDATPRAGRAVADEDVRRDIDAMYASHDHIMPPNSRAAQATPAEGAEEEAAHEALKSMRGVSFARAREKFAQPAGAADRTRGAGAPDLDAIEARASIAQMGPWYVENDGETTEDGPVFWPAAIRSRDGSTVVDCAEADTDAATAQFIAHARTDVPALVAYARALEQECATLRGDAAIGALARAWWEDRREQPVSYLTMCKEYTALVVALDAARAGRPAGEGDRA